MVDFRRLLAIIMTWKIKQTILDWLFPKECVGCRVEGALLCAGCAAKIAAVDDNLCLLCNRNLGAFGICETCAESTYLDEIIAACVYKGTTIERAIHCFKFNFVEELAAPLANFLALKLRRLNYREKIKKGIIIPIPLHDKRFLERGFNQAELLARALTKQIGGAVYPDILQRVKFTSQQAKLERSARMENIKEAFVCLKPELIADQEVFLIDDVFTSGATMNEAARVLKAAGAKKITGLVIAHG
jgi:competence protein ComFC